MFMNSKVVRFSDMSRLSLDFCDALTSERLLM